jgi:radical SAM protein with 4Fe4S-binding SPASM domain
LIGQKVGLRLTLTRSTARDLDGIFQLIEQERIPRVCFYHLVPSGRGSSVEDLTLDESRSVVGRIMDKAREWSHGERLVEVLTVDNPCDGPYLYLKLLQEGRAERAAEVLELLKWNGGALAGSGVGIADIDFHGNVHPDQFWMDVSFGNVRERPFSQIWMDLSNPLMAGLKDRRGRIGGRCATCRFFDACGGGLRSRAAHGTGNPWAADPACYLTDEEYSAQA